MLYSNDKLLSKWLFEPINAIYDNYEFYIGTVKLELFVTINAIMLVFFGFTNRGVSLLVFVKGQNGTLSLF